MRGIDRINDIFSALPLSGRGDRGRSPGADGKARKGAPKPAARSQTDAVGFAQFAMSLTKGRQPRNSRDRGLLLPVHSHAQEDQVRQTYIGKGQFLVRQDQWDVLGRLIAETDRNRETIMDGQSHAALLSLGARSDFVEAARVAVAAGEAPDTSIIASLEEALEDYSSSWGVGVVVAQAHMDIGMAMLGPRRPSARPPADNPEFLYHFRRAGEILDQFCPVEENSALLAEARCTALLGAPDARDRVADDYADLIDLDPTNPRHMRTYGLQLLPRWFGSFEMLDDQAHETAERTEDLWGDAGYAWVWLDVLRAVPEAAGRLDLDRYLEGLNDILQFRPGQRMANLIAAHCGIVMDPSSAPDDMRAGARENRAAIHERFGKVLRNDLRELYPRYWAEAQQSPFVALPASDVLAEEGEAIARSLISREFHEELAQGHIVEFTAEGVHLREAD
ncbi:hypothetical protein [Oceanicola sp. 22II-s10i]|uniref:hypothetical protein n=1 Tax=Oceanicola sp. 22II-s10i TaxID=1317116 RepID=UPI000B522117|nr:hypothetical protein [Oceanicola sp. 22II-s10i]